MWKLGEANGYETKPSRTRMRFLFRWVFAAFRRRDLEKMPRWRELRLTKSIRVLR